MDKVSFELAALNQRGEQFIRATAKQKGEDGLIARKTALIEVDPEQAQEVMEKFAKGEWTISFGARIRGAADLYEHVVNKEPVEVEND